MIVVAEGVVDVEVCWCGVVGLVQSGIENANVKEGFVFWSQFCFFDYRYSHRLKAIIIKGRKMINN